MGGTRSWNSVIVTISAVLFGLLITLFFMSLFQEVLLLILKLSFSRGAFFKRERHVVSGVVLVSTVVYFSLGLHGGLGKPSVSTYEIDVNKFPSSSYKIVQLSDLHIGPLLRKNFILNCIEMVNSLTPDLVVITGDVIDMPAVAQIEDIKLLGQLSAKDGVYFVPGNHDYYRGIEPLVKLLRSVGITPLMNEVVEIKTPDGRFQLAGLIDRAARGFLNITIDYSVVFQNLSDEMTTVMLSHRPDILGGMTKEVDLLLSGHTHGGQLFPFSILTSLVHPYLKGLHQHTPKMKVFVNQGTGLWGPPLRVGTKSEIAEFIIHGK